MRKKNGKIIFSMICYFMITIFLCISSKLSAQNTQDTYIETLQFLQKEGFNGIDSALVRFESIIEKDPDFTKAYLSAAEAYLLKFEFSKFKHTEWITRSIQYLNKVIEKKENLPRAYFKRSIAFLNLEKSDLAEADLIKAIEIKPAHLDAHLFYLQLLLSSKREKEANRLADIWITNYPKDSKPSKYFGDIFFKEHAYRDALRFYQKAVQRSPDDPDIHYAMGKAYQHLNITDSAITAFNATLTLDSKIQDARFSLALCLSQANRTIEAIEQFEINLKTFPKDAATWNNLALLYEHNGHLTKAKLAWLKVKEHSKDELHRTRAEDHLYRLIQAPGKEDPKSASPEKSMELKNRD
jgi:tetratricopeptide (TPR) repeat protein